MSEDMQRRAIRLNGILTGMCKLEEYEDLLAAGLLYRRYEGALGLMGLSTLRTRPEPNTPACSA